MLERLNKIFPNCGYVLIPKYNPEQWEGKTYDSKLDHKATTTKWNTKPLSYEEAQHKVEEGYRIGWVVPKGVVVVDIDNNDDERSQEYILKLLDKFETNYSFNYTSRGVHIIFIDPSESIKTVSEYRTGLNVQIDTRANKTGYIVLPCNDPHRAWGQVNDVNEEIPYFMKPVCQTKTPSFIGMANGDGRNDALWKWRGKLEACHVLNEKEIEKCIRIINENFFETPMTNQELFKTVLREKSKDKREEQLEKDNVYNKFAEELISKFDIVSFFGNFYMYNGTYYKPINEIEVEKLIHYELSRNISRDGRKEIMGFLKIKTQIREEDFDNCWYKIACKNGIINLVTGELEEPSKADINTIYIPWSYNTDPVYSPRIDQFMKEVTNGDALKMEFLYQIAGYCLLKKNLFEKFFIMKGEGGTGKSTYTNLLQNLVGSENCAHIGLADFDKEYYLATGLSKLLNIDDDVVDGKTLENTGRFKSIVSGNVISVRQIYKPVLEYKPYMTLVFNCNKLPRLMDKTSGLYRRMILIELNHKVEHPDPLFMNKVTEQDMEYFLFKAVSGIKVAIEEGRFRVTYSEKELLKLFQRRQSPLNEWLYEQDMRAGDLYGQVCNVLYTQFCEWCVGNGYKGLSSSFTFKEDICSIYDMELRFEKTEGKVPRQIFFKRGDFDKNYKPF